MKKTLAMLLALAMVSALCGMLFVSAEDANLASGKEVANAEINGNNATYYADLTDGVLAEEVKFDGTVAWFGYYYNPSLSNEENQDAGSNSVDGVASPTIDLGAAYDLSSVRVHAFVGSNSGILAPSAVSVEVSADGETYTKAAEVTVEGSDEAQKIEWIALDVDAEARYVRINLTHTSTWLFLDEIEVYGAEAAGDDEPDSSEEAPSEDTSSEETPSEPAKTYEDTLVKGEDGNYSCEVPYGYTWTVNYVDGKIVGEDVTICTTDEAYKACNPNWAITILAELQEDGTYVAVQDAVATPGNADAVTVGENQIAIVVHSAASNPDPDKDGKTYANWKGKVVAMAVKTGDVFTINEDKTAVYAVIPGESTDAPEESKPETSKPQTGDAGVLVFAVLGVVAICGAAVTIKARG